MKIRFSKTLAAVLAAATVTAISGISAMAASVKTTTTYVWEPADATTTQIEVISKVTDTTNKGAQVTYLVATPTPSAEGAIKYIDQAMLDETTGEATFTFKAMQSEIYGATVSAKFGSDADIEMPTFEFTNGVDYYATGKTTCVIDNVDYQGGKKTVIYGTVTGAAKEYGVKIGEEKYPAMGTFAAENGGRFAIVIYGWEYDENYAPVAYVE